jgi:predicted DNA-binding transcriptional regulator AlpA
MEISLANLAGQPLTHRGYLWDPGRPIMLSPENAMQILDARLGITVGRSTFYRWIQTGRFFSIKLGGKIFVPLSEIETVVQKLSHGERL